MAGASATAFAAFMGRFGAAGRAEHGTSGRPPETLRGAAGALEEAHVSVQSICENLLGEVSRLKGGQPARRRPRSSAIRSAALPPRRRRPHVPRSRRRSRHSAARRRPWRGSEPAEPDLLRPAAGGRARLPARAGQHRAAGAPCRTRAPATCRERAAGAVRRTHRALAAPRDVGFRRSGLVGFGARRAAAPVPRVLWIPGRVRRVLAPGGLDGSSRYACCGRCGPHAIIRVP